MTRVEYLTELDRRLSALSKEQADEYLAYYAEMLADRMEDGMSEEEAVASMERVDVIANRILGKVYTTPAKKNSNGKWIAIAVIVIAVACSIVVGCMALFSLPFRLVGVDRVEYIDSVVIEEIPTVSELPDEIMLFETTGISTLDVKWDSGYVLFEMWDSNMIGVDDWGQQVVNCTREDGTLYVDTGSSLNVTGELVIYLPYSFAENKLDALRISVTSADLSLYDINARSLTITNTSGYLDVSGCFDNVSVNTISGDISLSGSMETVEIDSVSGTLFINCNNMLRRLKAHTISADMNIYIPMELGFDLKFTGVSGTFTSGSLGIYDEEDVAITYGDGEVEVELSTNSGWVCIEQE